jgi:hypothetical protein
MRPSVTTDLEYGGHGQEIRRFGQVLSQAGDLW